MRAHAWIVCCMAAVLWLGAGVRPVLGQGDQMPAEVTALFDDISDIDKLRVLNPLHLSADQIDKLVAAIKETQKTYTEHLQAAAVPPIRSIAKEIKDTREKVLKGEAIPKDFDEKVKALQDEFVKRRNREDDRTLSKLVETFTGMLSKTQRTAAVNQAKTVGSKKGTDEDLIQFYVLGTFIAYPRIVPLLQDMKKAAEAAESASRGTTQTGTPVRA